ncbi:MAG: hypothetical protein QF731_08125, partial [Verrucomicrobiota bacterium]|nr:hypothetical protein [Verrucomicrobiota bacterium]
MKVIINNILWATVLISVESAISANNLDYETFDSDPMSRGWRIHGDKSLFVWDEDAKSLQVNWDSEKPNSFFYKPIGRVLTDADSFAFTFQITLDLVKAGYLEGKPYTFEIALGLLNLTSAKEKNFIRGTGSDSPNLVEWDYFPDTGFGATVSPALASGNSQFSAGFTFPAELLIGKSYCVKLIFNAEERMLKAEMLENGKPWEKIADVKIGSDFSGFSVDVFSISSFSAKDSESSLFAIGTIDEIALSASNSLPRLFGMKIKDSEWQAKSFLLEPDKWKVERSNDMIQWDRLSRNFDSVNYFQCFIDASTNKGILFYRL